MSLIAFAPRYSAVISPSVSVMYALIIMSPHFVVWIRNSSQSLTRKRIAVLSVIAILCAIAPGLWQVISFEALQHWILEGGILLTLSVLLLLSRKHLGGDGG
jgi:hypothetical protein